jgi:hypothetical protein
MLRTNYVVMQGHIQKEYKPQSLLPVITVEFSILVGYDATSLGNWCLLF